MSKKMKLTLANSVFKDAPVVSVAAKPGGSEGVQASLPVGMQFQNKDFFFRWMRGVREILLHF
jgi:hypothetical protein